MGILSRLLDRRKKKTNALSPIDPSQGIMILNRDVETKYRRAQDVPDKLQTRLTEICRTTDCVAKCCLLDVVEPATGDIKLFISLTLDKGEQDLPSVAPEMQKVFKEFPEYY